MKNNGFMLSAFFAILITLALMSLADETFSDKIDSITSYDSTLKRANFK